ncbi:hypothetical protein Metli_0789 [Methanofollis liminatans DSM 4140]|uniref:Uncharacterized protein n=1 Tax=Methanofollis liminatans DSM 4140 TaxID=28892 RepID=J1L253_9EURY|nr:hypothetical protein Metli_0789 [Methanofollis liminatans DSM 4140]
MGSPTSFSIRHADPGSRISSTKFSFSLCVYPLRFSFLCKKENHLRRNHPLFFHFYPRKFSAYGRKDLSTHAQPIGLEIRSACSSTQFGSWTFRKYTQDQGAALPAGEPGQCTSPPFARAPPSGPLSRVSSACFGFLDQGGAALPDDVLAVTPTGTSFALQKERSWRWQTGTVSNTAPGSGG